MYTHTWLCAIIAFVLGCSEYQFKKDVESADAVDTGSRLQPWIEVSPHIIDFGVVGPGDVLDEQVTVRNKGGAPLDITDVFLDLNEGFAYNLTILEPFAWELAPDDLNFIDVSITGPEDTIHLGTLRIDSNDPDHPVEHVELLHQLPDADPPPDDDPPPEEPPAEEPPPEEPPPEEPPPEEPPPEEPPPEEPPPEEPPPEEPVDECWEPEDGYEEHPAARIFTDDSTTPVTVTYVESETSYENELWLDSPESTRLFMAWADPIDSTYTMGPYPVDSELIFGIEVLSTGMHWQSGPASRNSDGVVHVSVTYEGDCSWLIGFEDLTGGGDLDFNDVVLRVQGMLRQEE